MLPFYRNHNTVFKYVQTLCVILTKTQLVMKKHFLVLMILCFSMLLKSENYHPFPTENAIWHALGFDFSKENDPNSKMYSHKYFVNGDTIIENETWQKIYFTNNYLGNIDFKIEMNYVAAIRENQQKQILAKFPQLPEFVLYDFSLEIGDTIWYEYAAFTMLSSSYPIYFDMEDDFYAPHYKIVVDKDSILLKNGQYRNRLILHSFSGYGNLHIHNHWIEGFGCTHWSGLFHPIDIIRCGKCVGFTFACFMQDDEVIYLNNPYCDDCLCETFTSIDHIDYSDELLTVYPNPSKGNLTIAISESATGNLVLRISDISGKKTFEQHLRNQQQINMNLSDYKSGFYIIQIWDEDRNKLIATEKIIIE